MKKVSKPRLINNSTVSSGQFLFINHKPLPQLMEMIKTVDVNSQEAKANKNSFSDNNGGRINYRKVINNYCVKNDKHYSRSEESKEYLEKSV